MDYPLIIGGERRGTVSFTQNGLYTVAEASLDQDPGRLVRLWAQGEGESAYLGLMLPWSGGLYLRRKLSRREMALLPKTIECVADSQTPSCRAEKSAETEKPASPGEDEKEEEASERPKACPWPAPVTEKTDGLLWFRRADGTLAAHDGLSALVAIPASLRSSTGRAVLRRIEGEDYLVFRTCAIHANAV